MKYKARGANNYFSYSFNFDKVSSPTGDVQISLPTTSADNISSCVIGSLGGVKSLNATAQIAARTTPSTNYLVFRDTNLTGGSQVTVQADTGISASGFIAISGHYISA